MWFYILGLLIQIVVTSTQSYHRSTMGEYYVEWREVGQCSAEKRGTNEIASIIRITKKNRKPELIGNSTFLIDFDDSVAVKMNFHILGSNLAWLPNAYSMTFPKGCSGLVNILRQGWTDFMKSMNMPPRCPMRKGFYEIKPYDANKILQYSLFPKQFIYGRYKIELELIKKNTQVGCYYYIIDVLPLWQKKENRTKS